MVILTEVGVLEQWSAMLDGCEGEEEGLLRRVESELARRQIPELVCRRSTVGPSYSKAWRGKRRDGLAIEHPRFPRYQFCVMARDYGTSLDVSWYVTGSRRAMLLLRIIQIPFVGLVLRLFGVGKDLDMFDQADLRAYVTTGQRAVRVAMEQLLEEKKLEIGIDWKSRGLLGVS